MENAKFYTFKPTSKKDRTNAITIKSDTDTSKSTSLKDGIILKALYIMDVGSNTKKKMNLKSIICPECPNTDKLTLKVIIR